MRILLLSLMTILSLTACREGEVKDGEVIKIEETKPYKATTVDECINEKECVWYHFEKTLLAENNIKSSDGVSEIRKWSEPIDIYGVVEGASKEQAEIFNGKLQDAVNSMNKAFPYGVRYSDYYKMLIVFTDDPDRDYYNKYGPQILEQLGKSTYDIYGTLSKNKECFGMKRFYKESGDVAVGYYFIRSDNSSVINCIYGVFFLSFGFGMYIPNLEFSFLDEDRRYLRPTDLDLFMIKLLYHESFVSGMPQSEIKKSFDIAFDKVKKKSLKMN